MIDESDPPLAAIAALLDTAGIPYMVVGSFASAYHGNPRTTYDLDLVIDPSLAQLETLVRAIDPETYYVDLDVARDAFHRRGMFNVIEIATAWKIDLVIRKARPFSIEELRRRQRVEILGAAVAAATAEDTILAKLEWFKAGGSERQLDDVVGIIRVQGEALDRTYIARWAEDLGVGELWDRVIRSR